MRTEAGANRRYTAVQRLAAVVVPVGVGLVALAESALIGHAAVHLCGWPATISCDFGLPMVWALLRVLLWAFVLVAAVDAWCFLRAPTGDAVARIFTWGAWAVSAVLITFATVADRILHAGDVVLGALLLMTGVGLAGATLGARLPVPERRVALALAPVILVVATAPFWAPPALVQVGRWEPMREERARRAASERCLADMDKRQRRGPATQELPVCEIWPVPTDGPTPPG